MTETKSEAREFILVKEKLSNAALAFDLAFDLDPFIPQNWPPSSYVDTLHVIEKSAYAYAVDQWDYWVEEARKAQAKHERVLQMLEVAETALERVLLIENPDTLAPIEFTVREALAQIESLK